MRLIARLYSCVVLDVQHRLDSVNDRPQESSSFDLMSSEQAMSCRGQPCMCKLGSLQASMLSLAAQQK